ncbi:hypothetical protein GF336_02365 [Candidatus Woesearchaeota archaeon]|nr:hypothetical protein [Candidatus Woesearchaeota archaeon]
MAFGSKKQEEKNEGIYVAYIGKPVRVHSANTNNGINYGIVEHTDYDKTLLKLCLIDEPLDDKHNCRLEDKIATTIDTKTITKMEPLTEGYIEKYIDYVNSNPEKKDGTKER